MRFVTCGKSGASNQAAKLLIMKKHTPILHLAIVSCHVLFVTVLFVATYYDTSIFALHLAECIPYAAGALLCLKHNKWGYFLSFAAGAFWLWSAGFLTTFIHNGFTQLGQFIATGVARADIMIAVPAAIATGGLAIFSLLAYLIFTKKSWGDILSLVLAGVGVFAFFITIFWLFAPRYLGMFSRFLPS
jgi:hypothetical protein